MTNHLANASIALTLRTELANLSLALADALIEKHIACMENSRAHTAEDDSDAMMARVEDAINEEFAIRAKMNAVATEITKARA